MLSNHATDIVPRLRSFEMRSNTSSILSPLGRFKESIITNKDKVLAAVIDKFVHTVLIK